MIERTACLLGRTKQLYRNQAIEACLMNTLPPHTALLFLWENQRAVLQGFKEDTQEIVRLEALRANGGVLGRRLSGGRAFYLSEGILSYSLLLPKEDFHIGRQNELLCRAIASLGVYSKISTGIDLSVNGRMIAANAYYKSSGAAVQHGCILCDADPGQMAADMTELLPSVSLSELVKNGGVRPAEEALWQAMGECYHCDPVWLDERSLDRQVIDDAEEKFQKDRWILQNPISGNFKVEERFPWGKISVILLVENSMIQKAQVFTNAMETAWFDLLEKSLQGSPFLISAIAGRINRHMEKTQDPWLRQISLDFCRLICGHIRQSNRRGEAGSNP